MRSIPARRPWTPRFSPDGEQLAYGAFGSGRNTSDVWVTDLTTGGTRRLTDDAGPDDAPHAAARLLSLTGSSTPMRTLACSRSLSVAKRTP